MNYMVNIESLHRNFPRDFEVPSLLVNFATWLEDKPAGSLGYFCLESERFSDSWIENGADLHEYFAFFIRDPTGGRIGYWRYDGRATQCPPIVLIGSEGELSILGNTLQEFLERLAEGRTQAPDLDSRDQGGNEAADLGKWLKTRIPGTSTQRRHAYPGLEQWMDDWGQRQREWIDKDILHVQIADRLRKYVKPNAEPWETECFDVLLVGTQFRMWHRSFGPKPMPQNDITDLESLFRSVREQRAQNMPERGLWFSAFVRVGSQGGAVLCCNFMDEPRVLDERLLIPASDYELDLRAFPRSRHWFPKWLMEYRP